MPSSNSPDAQAVAVGTEVRAALARKRKTQADLAEMLSITANTASKRLSGEVPFDVVELFRVAAWLEIDVQTLIPAAGAVA